MTNGEKISTSSTSTIVDPNVFQAMLLDGIDQKLKSNNALLESVVKIQGNIIALLSKINKEQTDEADEGKYRIEDNTATTTFTEIDVIQLIGHSIKGYMIINDGTNDIYIAHNIVNISPDVLSKVKATEKLTFTYNRDKIQKMYLKTLSGTSDYRLTLIW